ncbi:helix-turn-helix domain-containing protein [Paracoccus cavernae]|uniref:Helix-turn-helix domain-containing protein n=1 Tax=Paracoccus cavernae TaxID=1571207 RepID=A0ABT8D637_9RHOB|nr:helix-turn-helix domain-containing protein [Paracoccus cavernae]
MTVNLARHADIRKRLGALGLSLSALAREVGVTPETVTIVSQGYRRSRRVEKQIAAALGTTPEQLFPERYLSEEGLAYRRMGKRPSWWNRKALQK